MIYPLHRCNLEKTEKKTNFHFRFQSTISGLCHGSRWRFLLWWLSFLRTFVFAWFIYPRLRLFLPRPRTILRRTAPTQKHVWLPQRFAATICNRWWWWGMMGRPNQIWNGTSRFGVLNLSTSGDGEACWTQANDLSRKKKCCKSFCYEGMGVYNMYIN